MGIMPADGATVMSVDDVLGVRRNQDSDPTTKPVLVDQGFDSGVVNHVLPSAAL
jgi:hypothetical protein